MTSSGVRWILGTVSVVALVVGCGPTITGPLDGGETTSGSGSTSSSTGLPVSDSVDESVGDFDLPSSDMGSSSCGAGRIGCTDRLDVLVVIDNSRTMAEEQRTFARSVPGLVEGLRDVTDNTGQPLGLDIQVMVTTTDVGNPLCTPFEPAGYEPAMGAPISTPCIERQQDFTDLAGTIFAQDVCLEACPLPVAPDDPFVAFGPEGSNVPPTPPTDINGDGVDDPPEALALACIGPQGINGCGYESPLEAMRLALDPQADHNQGDRPFLRPDAVLAIMIISDEADCSVSDPSMMRDTSLYNVNPLIDLPLSSSAICWNAGVQCEGPDASGTYLQCYAEDQDRMHSVEGYVEFLREELSVGLDKDVMMMPFVGVPLVTAHNPDPPFMPTVGGELELVYHWWREGVVPEGDMLPDDAAEGVTAALQQFEFGVGPGCTGIDERGAFTGQATPPVRMLEVCHGLDLGGEDELASVRCCVESVCDVDYQSAAQCIHGIYAANLFGWGEGG